MSASLPGPLGQLRVTVTKHMLFGEDSFPRAAITKHPKLGGFQQHEFIL